MRVLLRNLGIALRRLARQPGRITHDPQVAARAGRVLRMTDGVLEPVEGGRLSP